MQQEILQRAIQLHKQGDVDKAKQLYQQLLEKQPKNADILHLLGIVSAQLQQWDDAQLYIQQALAIEPESPSYHNSLGNVYKNLNDTDSAIQQYQQVIKLEPNNATAYNNLGNIYYQTKDFDKALECYRRALEILPNYTDAHYNIGKIHIQHEEYDLAIEQFEKIILHDPGYLEAHGQLGQLYQALGKYQKAIDAYRKRLEFEPDNTTVLHNIGTVMLLQGNPKEAQKYFLRAQQISPDADTLYNLGICYQYQDRYEDAIEYFTETLRLKPEYSQAEINLAQTYLTKEDYANAILHYNKALKLDPSNNEVNFILSALTEKKPPKSPPKEFIENLFDQYAPFFETHLQEMLHYQAPQLLYNAVVNYIRHKPTSWKVLDLGCGTGLCGPLFKKISHELIGIDLSSKMIDIAKSKNIYAQLEVMDIENALEKFQQLDLIIAADVFSYIGDLANIFSQANKALNPSGLFCFTTEISETGQYQLLKTVRYAHSEAYIKKLARTYHFEVIQCDKVTLRTQKKNPLEGFLFLLHKTDGRKE